LNSLPGEAFPGGEKFYSLFALPVRLSSKRVTDGLEQLARTL